MPHTYLVTDHKQSFRDTDSNERRRMPSSQTWTDEENQRFLMRQKLFPDLTDDVIIFANFNQLYKIDPSIFAAWLRILREVPNSVLWLLRFPPAGEEHLLRTAKAWSSAQVASRIRFTHVAKKNEHIRRARVADIFLDTIECNAHTVAAEYDVHCLLFLDMPSIENLQCFVVRHTYNHLAKIRLQNVFSCGCQHRAFNRLRRSNDHVHLGGIRRKSDCIGSECQLFNLQCGGRHG